MDKYCQRSYYALLISQSLAKIGDTLYFMAVTHYILKQIPWADGACVRQQTLFVIISLSMLFGTSLLAPIIFRRLHLYQSLVRARVLQLGIIALLMILAYLKLDTIWSVFGIFILLAAVAFCEGVLSASRNAYWSHLVKSKLLAKSNKIVFSLFFPIAACMGYFFSSFFWGSTAGDTFLWQIAIFIIFCIWTISLLLSMLIKIRPSLDQKKQKVSLGVLTSAWRYTFSHSFFRRLFLIELLEVTSAGIWTAPVLNIFIIKLLMCDGSWLPYLHGFYKVGGVVGGVLILTVIFRRVTSMYVLLFESLFHALLIGIYCLFPYIGINLVLSILMGISHSLRLSVQHTLMQSNTTLERLPQIYSVYKLVWLSAYNFGGVLMAYIVAELGLKWVYVVAIGLLCWSSAIAWRMLFLNRSLKHSSN
ncbi:MAG: hypothetical protein RLZ12_390 [Bacillota bacterium]|jgi:hypothetical protein